MCPYSLFFWEAVLGGYRGEGGVRQQVVSNTEAAWGGEGGVTNDTKKQHSLLSHSPSHSEKALLLDICCICIYNVKSLFL